MSRDPKPSPCVLVLCVLVALGLRASPAQTPVHAVGSQVPPEALAIYSSVMSPFCPELMLASCPTYAADSLRHAIAARVRAGASRAAILDALYATYGDVIRAAPEARGFGLVAWLAPVVVLMLGATFVMRWLTRTAGATPAGNGVQEPPADLPANDPAVERLRLALRHDG